MWKLTPNHGRARRTIALTQPASGSVQSTVLHLLHGSPAEQAPARAAIEPEMDEEEELTDVDEDASALLPTYTAGEPPPLPRRREHLSARLLRACSELANLLAAAAVGRAGDAAWLYCVLGVSELRAAVRPRLAAWTRTLESAGCPRAGARAVARRSEEARDMYEALTVLYNLPHPGRARYTSDAARTSAKAKYEAAQKKVAPIMQALCDGEPRGVGSALATVAEDAEGAGAAAARAAGRDRERLLLADDTLQHHLYKHLCSPVMEPAKASALLASERAAWRSGGGARPFHDVDEAHLVQHLGWSFGPHGESILALMRKVCDVCVDLGHGTACNTWGGPGCGTRHRDINCVAIVLDGPCTQRDVPGVRVLHARTPCIDAQSAISLRGVAAPPSTAAPRKRSSKRCTERGAGYPTRRATCRPPSSSRWCARARWARTWCTTGPTSR